MNHISANELKTRGIAAIEQALAEQPEAIVSVRGKDRFVVLDIAQYQRLRECELEVALAEGWTPWHELSPSFYRVLQQTCR